MTDPKNTSPAEFLIKVAGFLGQTADHLDTAHAEIEAMRFALIEQVQLRKHAELKLDLVRRGVVDVREVDDRVEALTNDGLTPEKVASVLELQDARSFSEGPADDSYADPFNTAVFTPETA